MENAYVLDITDVIIFSIDLAGMDENKKDSVYLALTDSNLPIELIMVIKSYLTREDWSMKNIDYFSDPYDHKFLKQFKNRMRNRSFTWPYYNLQ